LPSENLTPKCSTTTPSFNPNGTNQAAINMHYRRAKAPGAADFFTVVTYNRQPARVVGSKQVGWWAVPTLLACCPLAAEHNDQQKACMLSEALEG
jgi:hypothetical protein